LWWWWWAGSSRPEAEVMDGGGGGRWLLGDGLQVYSLTTREHCLQVT